MKLTDELLYQYAGEARDLWLSTLPQRDAVPEHCFSRRFIRKMNRLLRQQRRSPYMRRIIHYTRNAAIFALALIGVTFAGLMTVEAYRGAIIDVITDKLSNILTFEYSSPIHEENAEFVDIELHYMPEGMAENELGFFETTVDRHRQFEDGKGGIMELNEWLISADRGFSVGMLTEDMIAEEQFLIGSEQATMITRKDDTSSTGIGVSVMWTHGDVAYAFYTNLSAEEAKKIVLHIEYLPYDAETAKAKRAAQDAEAKAYADALEREAELLEQQKPALMEEWGMNFTEEEVNAAIAVAQQYYKEWSEEDLDPELLYPEEYSRAKQFQAWLKQGVDIVYDKETAFSYVNGSSAKAQIEQQGAGTLIILTVTIPAASDYQGDRRITLTRENAQSEWTFLTEGPNV